MGNFWKDVLCCKVFKRIKGGNQKKTEVNWPELDTYCGCCTLLEGILGRSIGSLVVTLVFLGINGTLLGHILNVKAAKKGSNTTIEDKIPGLNVIYNENDVEKNKYIQTLIIAYYSLWIVSKTIYIIALLWTLPAVYKGSLKMFKILMYVSILNWIWDILISFLATTMIYNSILLRIPVILCILCDGYNILAMNSEHKRMTGKLKPRHNDVEGESNTQNLSEFRNASREEFACTTSHCRTCQCYESVQSQQPVTTPHSPDSIRIDTTPITNKIINDFELNYAITGVLNLEDIAAETSSIHIEPNTLDLKLNTTDEDKIVVTDEPVIYDVEQLNTGTSPVIENKNL